MQPISKPTDISEKELELLDKPKEQDLHVDWIMRVDPKTLKPFGDKIYIAKCGCGSKDLIRAERGLRCQSCSKLHSHESYKRVQRLAKKKMIHGSIDMRVPTIMPDSVTKQYKKIRREQLIRQGVIRPKIIV